MKKGEGELAVEDWDFRALTPKSPTSEQRNEMHAAIFYEYARESDSIRELAAEYAKLPDAVRLLDEKPRALRDISRPVITGPVSRKLERMYYVPFWNCILWPPYFPETPWLKIPAKKRSARVQWYLAEQERPPILSINEFGERDRNLLPAVGGRSFLGKR